MLKLDLNTNQSLKSFFLKKNKILIGCKINKI